MGKQVFLIIFLRITIIISIEMNINNFKLNISNVWCVDKIFWLFFKIFNKTDQNYYAYWKTIPFYFESFSVILSLSKIIERVEHVNEIKAKILLTLWFLNRQFNEKNQMWKLKFAIKSCRVFDTKTQLECGFWIRNFWH